MSLDPTYTGKVRSLYDMDDSHMLIVTSDRISAFDVIMQEPIPDRGRILTLLTQFWLTEPLADLPSHYISCEVPEMAKDLDDSEGRCMVVRKAEMLPIEFIVRHGLAGTGWKEYVASGTLHGRKLPESLQLGSMLPEPVLTPSTKGELGTHDVNLRWDEAADIIGVGLMHQCETLTLEAFDRGARHAKKHGFVLADTKFELGFIDGELSLCDEILTPDSSRYWPESWNLGEAPPAYDKQVLRDYLETVEGWNKMAPPPHLPDEIVQATRQRYIDVYERITSTSL